MSVNSSKFVQPLAATALPSDKMKLQIFARVESIRERCRVGTCPPHRFERWHWLQKHTAPWPFVY